MDYCNECRFFSDLGRCRNGSTRRSDVGYFQKACPKGLPKEYPPHETEQDHTEIAQDNPKIEHTMDQNEQPKTKKCRNCGRELPLDQFSRNGRGFFHVCKDCMKAKRHQAAEDAATGEKEPKKPKPRPTHNYRMPHQKSEAQTFVSALSNFSDLVLIDELKKRGYTGKLTKTMTVYLNSEE